MLGRLCTVFGDNGWDFLLDTIIYALSSFDPYKNSAVD